MRSNPEIDPEEHFKGQTYQGKVAIITGASRGIGEEMALMYTQASAYVVIASRKQETLDSVKKRILALVPTAEVLNVPTNVAVVEQVEALVAAVIARYGRLDVIVANAGTAPEFKDLLGDKDPFAWWGVMETNLRGTFNTARFSLSHLAKTKGSFVAITSGAASMRVPTMSSYGISKFAINRLVEFIHLEYPDVRTFALHPGVVDTEMGRKQSAYAMDDRKADYLSGRYIAANWDLGEIARGWKEKIIKEDALVNRLMIPTQPYKQGFHRARAKFFVAIGAHDGHRSLMHSVVTEHPVIQKSFKSVINILDHASTIPLAVSFSLVIFPAVITASHVTTSIHKFKLKLNNY